MPLLCPYLSGRSAFQDKLLDWATKLFRQLALGKAQVLVKGSGGDPVGVTLPVGGDGDILPCFHLRQHKVHHLPGDMLPSMSWVHRQKAQHAGFL